MKKFIPVVLLAIFCSSCQKLLDYSNYKEAEPTPSCRISRTMDTSGTEIYTVDYQYNASGDPVEVTYSTYYTEFDYLESYFFTYTYDGLGRIRTVTSDWVYGAPQTHFAYEGNAKLPVRDTLYPTFPNIFVEDFTYDSQGRIIKVVKRIIEQWEEDLGEYPDEVYNYYYDLRGNRQEHPSNPGYNGLVQYTDNPAINSLHFVWKIMSKDFSRNARPLYYFNDRGLPSGSLQGGGIEYVCGRE